MHRRNDGCIMLPILLIYFLVKIALVLCAYALAAMMTFATLMWVPLIIVISLFSDKVSVGTCLVIWFALATEFAHSLFDDAHE